MEITLQKYELANMLRDASEIAVQRYRIERGEERPFVSQREAYRLFGEGTVKRWVQEGLIKRKKDGNKTSTVRYDRLELEILSKSNNRLTYLDSEERKQKQ